MKGLKTMKKQYTYGNATFETLDALFEEVKKTLTTAEEGITTLLIGVETARTWDDVVADVIAYFEDNDDDFIEVIEALDDENGILGDDRIYDKYDIDDVLYGMSISEVLDNLDDWYSSDDYFVYNCYGLRSVSSKDYSDFLNGDFVEELYDHEGNISIPSEVQELFDEWKGNEEDEADEDDDENDEDDDNGDE